MVFWALLVETVACRCCHSIVDDCRQQESAQKSYDIQQARQCQIVGAFDSREELV